MGKLGLNQLAAMNMVYNRYSFTYFLDSLERMGVKQFELWAGAPHFCNFIQSLSDAGKLRKEVEARGLKIVCLTPEQVLYPHNIASADKELRQFSLEYFYNYIGQTAELGVDKMLCCAGWGDYDQDREDAWKRSVESLWSMVERAKKAGITLAFEILGRFESNLVNDFASTRRMMEEIQDPCFKLCLDTVPMRTCGSSISDFFQAFPGRICHFHMTDGTPAGHVPCGTGEHPIGAYIAELERLGYDRYITLEIGDTSCCTNPHEATESGFNYVKQFL